MFDELYDFLQYGIALKELASTKHYLEVNGDHLKEKEVFSEAFGFVQNINRGLRRNVAGLAAFRLRQK